MVSNIFQCLFILVNRAFKVEGTHSTFTRRCSITVGCVGHKTEPIFRLVQLHESIVCVCVSLFGGVSYWGRQNLRGEIYHGFTQKHILIKSLPWKLIQSPKAQQRRRHQLLGSEPLMFILSAMHTTAIETWPLMVWISFGSKRRQQDLLHLGIWEVLASIHHHLVAQI